MSRGSAAILLVNGGEDPPAGCWLDAALTTIRDLTEWPEYRIYVWNNNVEDQAVPGMVGRADDAVLVQADPGEELSHPHAVPLQRLYERARADGAKFVVAFDSDAQPVSRGWLTDLIKAIENGAAMAGVWRDEISAAVRPPYLHASCLLTTVALIEERGLRFDYFSEDRSIRQDTLSSFTDVVRGAGLPMEKLHRSNLNNLHWMMAGIYGDRVYHHGAGSRGNVRFWDDRHLEAVHRENTDIRDDLARFLFNDRETFLDFLRGRGSRGAVQADRQIVFLLGMHESGADCLAGCLTRSGLNPGDESGGDHEEPAPAVRLNESILFAAGGGWSDPPRDLVVGREQADHIDLAARKLHGNAPCVFSDPRVLFLLSPWKKAARRPVFVGTFRHPAAVARTLERRREWPAERSFELWKRYNEKLAALHRAASFPLVSFELSDPDAYLDRVAGVALSLGLKPDLPAMTAIVASDKDHAGRADDEIPDTCRKLWDYLVEHRAEPPAEGTFDAALLTFLKDRQRFAAEWDDRDETPGLVSRLGGRLRRFFHREP